MMVTWRLMLCFALRSLFHLVEDITLPLPYHSSFFMHDLFSDFVYTTSHITLGSLLFSISRLPSLPLFLSLISHAHTLTHRRNGVLGQFSMGSLENTLTLQYVAYLKKEKEREKKKDHLDNQPRKDTHMRTHTVSCFSYHQWFRYWCFPTGTKRYLIVKLKISHIPAYYSCAHTYKCTISVLYVLYAQ